MSEQTTHAEIQAIIEREKAGWQDIVSQVGSDRLEQPGVMGDWTFKDFAAHMTGWRENTIQKLNAAARGVEPSPPWPAGMNDVDEINDWIYQQNRDRPADDVLRDSEMSFDHLSEVVREFTADELNDPDRVAWLEGTSLADAFRSGDMFGHYHEEHAEDVQAFLRKDS